MMVAFATVSALLGASVTRGLASLFFGFGLGLIGIDPQTGEARLALGIPQLLDGVDVVLIVIGLFAVGETPTWRGGARPTRPSSPCADRRG
jgi:putative tricarboxylic transport membrane protein